MPFAQNSDIFAVMGEFGTFDTITGGELTQNTTEYTPGGLRTALKLPGTYTYSDITLTRVWDPLRDGSLVDWAKRNMRDGIPEPRQVTKMTKTQQGIIQDFKTYLVIPKALKTPDGKNGDNTMAEISITLAVEQEL